MEGYLLHISRALLLCIVYLSFFLFLTFGLRSVKAGKFLWQCLFKDKKLVIQAATICLVFLSLYFIGGQWIKTTSALTVADALFEADPKRVINDFTTYSVLHFRTSVHPLYVLMVNPAGFVLGKLIHSKIDAALFLNSFFGGLGVALMFVFFKILSKNGINSFLLAVLFSSTMSQMFFGMVPEVGALAVCSLMTTYILFIVSLEQKQMHTVLWVLSGIATFGVTITNFFQTLCCFTISVAVISNSHGKEKYLFIIKRIVHFVGIVVCCAMFFAVVQKIIFPSSFLFFIPSSMAPEKQFLSFKVFAQPLPVIFEMCKHFFLVDLAASLPNIFTMPEKGTLAMTFAGSWKYTFTGSIGAGLWLSLLFAAIVKGLVNERKNLPLNTALFICVLFNMALHCFYGVNDMRQNEPFVYSSNFTFLMILLLNSLATSKGTITRLYLSFLAVVFGLNNLMVLKSILSYYP